MRFKFTGFSGSILDLNNALMLSLTIREANRLFRLNGFLSENLF